MMLRALKAFDYNSRRFKAGELFEPASASDGHVLTIAQLAVEIDEEDKPPNKNKKRYKRSDMRAEDDE
jgi:hypothetical protein